MKKEVLRVAESILLPMSSKVNKYKEWLAGKIFFYLLLNLFFKWAHSGLFLFKNVLFKSQFNHNLKKSRCCACYSNPGPLDCRRRQIHWAKTCMYQIRFDNMMKSNETFETCSLLYNWRDTIVFFHSNKKEMCIKSVRITFVHKKRVLMSDKLEGISIFV